MSTLRPVDTDYDPGYPKRLTPEEVRNLLRPGLARRFSSQTLLAGAMLAAATAGCGLDTEPEVPVDRPKEHKTKRPMRSNQPCRRQPHRKLACPWRDAA